MIKFLLKTKGIIDIIGRVSPIVWDRLYNKNASRIKYTIDGPTFDDRSNYETLMNKSIDTAVKMRDVFKLYL